MTAIAQPGEYIPPETYTDFSELKGETIISNSVLCNCYLFTKDKYPTLPSTKEILVNLKATGSVAVFYYADTGLYHYAVVVKETDTHYQIEETNYKRCRHGERTIPKNDPALLGFFHI